MRAKFWGKWRVNGQYRQRPQRSPNRLLAILVALGCGCALVIGCVDDTLSRGLTRVVYDRARGDCYVSETSDVAYIAREFVQRHRLDWSGAPQQIHLVARFTYIVVYPPAPDHTIRALRVCIGGDQPRSAKLADASDLAELGIVGAK